MKTLIINKEKFLKDKLDNLENYGLISVIIPVYNCEKFLKQCIESILTQTYQNFELILICDKGKDTSEKICQEYANNNCKIKFIFRQNSKGVSSARNCGIDNISKKSKFVVFVDADDWVEPNYLEILLNNLINNNADISICSWKWETRTKIHFKQIKKQTCKILNKEEALKELFLSNLYSGALWQKMLKVSVLGDLRFDEKVSYGEDLQFSFNYLKKCNTTVWTKTKLYHYTYNSKSIVNSNFSYSRLSIIYMMQDLIKECESLNANVCEYAKALHYLHGIETLYFLKKRHFANKSIKNLIIKILQENKEIYDNHSAEYKGFRRFGSVASKLLGVKILKK